MLRGYSCSIFGTFCSVVVAEKAGRKVAEVQGLPSPCSPTERLIELFWAQLCFWGQATARIPKRGPQAGSYDLMDVEVLAGYVATGKQIFHT